jgi:hypothetical protein
VISQDDQLAIFTAQTENVRQLRQAWTAAQRSLNALLVRDERVTALLETKIQALILSAFSEATFSKLIHTPHGFELQEIEQIKNAARQNIAEAWTRCLDLGLRRVESGKSNYVPNTRQAVQRLIDRYIADSAIVRNKIAHGQWVQALNREQTAVNPDVSRQLANLTTVDLARVKTGLEGLCAIVENLIESPMRTFARDYWVIVSETEAKLKRMRGWTLEHKIAAMKRKQSYCKREASI